jgi:DNA-binding GntR family transcriptional regulator
MLLPHLRELILSGDLPPTAPIQEAELSRQLGVSRTPLREALKVLAAEGLVLLRPHRSPIVASVDPGEIAAIFETIVPLEALAGRLAAERAGEQGRARLAALHARLLALYASADRAPYFHLNREFHLEFATLAANPVLLATLADLHGKLMRGRASANLDRARWHQSTVEHAAILAAFTARQPERVGELLADHSRRTAEAVLAQLSRT